MVTPKPEETSGKFSKSGLAGKKLFRDMGLGKEAAGKLAEMGNFGLTRSTWSNYSTAERMLRKCGSDTGEKMELPLSQREVLVFIHWLVDVRKAKHGTISSYLAGLRQMHVVRGMESKIRSDLVNLVLAGKKNQEVLERKRGKEESRRLPVTITVMRLIKATLRESSMEKKEKLTMWAICCLAFRGAFWIHEIMSKEENRFYPEFTLLRKDLKVLEDKKEGIEMILDNAKWLKEDKRGTGVEVEVYATGSAICPVKALKKCWAAGREDDPKQPAFKHTDGRAWTGRQLNTEL